MRKVELYDYPTMISDLGGGLEMNLMIKIAEGDRTLSEWLAERIRIDVMEKYGIEVEVTYGDRKVNQMPLSEPSKSVSKNELKQNISGSRRTLDMSEWDDFPMALEPKHLKIILGIGINQVLQLIRNDPPFFVVRLGNRYKIAKVSLFEWLTIGKKHRYEDGD
jgi:hypothetical protein